MKRNQVVGVFAGTVIVVAMRWCDRLIGFISTIVLARLLVPEDFGIIAMASLVVGFADILLDMGVNIALIQKHDANQSHYDTAWTIRLLQMLVAAFAVVVSTPFAVEYFGDPRVASVLYFMAAGLVLAGFQNIGIVTFQKEMRFALEFRFTLSQRLFGFFITVIAAYILRNYWALVIGSLSGRAFGVILSYLMHPMRPRFSFSKFTEIFSVSQWILVRNIGLFLNNNLHRIIVGNRSSTTIMGAYTLANDVSLMPSAQILAPLNRVLFPAFVNAKTNLHELKRLFLLAQGLQTTLVVPASVGLALVANEVVIVLFGDKWSSAVPFIQILALANVFQAITTSGGYIMITLGRVRNTAVLVWLQVFIFGLLFVTIFPDSGAIQIALLRLATMSAGLALSIWMLLSALSNLSLSEVGKTIFRPCLATGVMALAVMYTGDFLVLPTFLVLVLKVLVGVITYTTFLSLFWLVAGKPEGAESYILDKFSEMKARLIT